MHGSSSSSRVSALPDWIFEVDEFDEELDGGLDLIDASSYHQVLHMIHWTLSLPFYALLCQSSSVISGKMPLKEDMRRDLYGPIFVLLCFVVILWAARKKDATWVFFIWTAGSMVVHRCC